MFSGYFFGVSHIALGPWGTSRAIDPRYTVYEFSKSSSFWRFFTVFLSCSIWFLAIVKIRSFSVSGHLWTIKHMILWSQGDWKGSRPWVQYLYGIVKDVFLAVLWAITHDFGVASQFTASVSQGVRFSWRCRNLHFTAIFLSYSALLWGLGSSLRSLSVHTRLMCIVEIHHFHFFDCFSEL